MHGVQVARTVQSLSLGPGPVLVPLPSTPDRRLRVHVYPGAEVPVVVDSGRNAKTPSTTSTAFAAARVMTDVWSTWVKGSMLQSTHSPDPSGPPGSRSNSITAA